MPELFFLIAHTLGLFHTPMGSNFAYLFPPILLLHSQRIVSPPSVNLLTMPKTDLRSQPQSVTSASSSFFVSRMKETSSGRKGRKRAEALWPSLYFSEIEDKASQPADNHTHTCGVLKGHSQLLERGLFPHMAFFLFRLSPPLPIL